MKKVNKKPSGRKMGYYISQGDDRLYGIFVAPELHDWLEGGKAPAILVEAVYKEECKSAPLWVPPRQPRFADLAACEASLNAETYRFDVLNSAAFPKTIVFKETCGRKEMIKYMENNSLSSVIYWHDDYNMGGGQKWTLSALKKELERYGDEGQ